MILREIEVKDFDYLWNLIETNSELLPINWPSKQSKFYDWLYLGLLDDFSSKYVIEFISDETTKDIVGLISVDLVTKQNHMQFKNTNIYDADITYLTSKEFAGIGVATFAVTEISKILIENSYKPIMRIAKSQKASARIAVKCGFIKIDDEQIFQDFDDDRLSLEIFRKIIA